MPPAVQARTELMLSRIARLRQTAKGCAAVIKKLRRRAEASDRGGPLTGWEKTVKLYSDVLDRLDYKQYPEQMGLGRSWGLGVFTARSRHFLPGDVVIVDWHNGGGERQPVWCCTGRGHPVKGLYVQYCRWSDPPKSEPGHVGKHRNRVPVRIVEHPDDLAGLPPDDPAVRRFVVETLCAGDAAPG